MDQLAEELSATLVKTCPGYSYVCTWTHVSLSSSAQRTPRYLRLVCTGTIALRLPHGTCDPASPPPCCCHHTQSELRALPHVYVYAFCVHLDAHTSTLHAGDKLYLLYVTSHAQLLKEASAIGEHEPTSPGLVRTRSCCM